MRREKLLRIFSELSGGGAKFIGAGKKKRFLLRPSLRGGGENQILASGPKNFSFDDDEMPRENSKEVSFSYGV